jgi:hypothetical protein
VLALLWGRDQARNACALGTSENGRRWRVVVTGKWQSLENGRRWRMAVAGEWQSLENGRRWRMAVAGEWQSLENGSRWRTAGAGEQQSLENGSRWRGKGVGEFRAPAPTLPRGDRKWQELVTSRQQSGSMLAEVTLVVL